MIKINNTEKLVETNDVIFMTDLDCGDYFHFLGRKDIYLKLDDMNVAVDLTNGEEIYADCEEFEIVPVEKVDIEINILNVYHY